MKASATEVHEDCVVGFGEKRTEKGAHVGMLVNLRLGQKSLPGIELLCVDLKGNSTNVLKQGRRRCNVVARVILHVCFQIWRWPERIDFGQVTLRLRDAIAGKERRIWAVRTRSVSVMFGRSAGRAGRR